MKNVRLVFGILALAGLALGLNVLVFKRDPFAFSVMLPLCFGLLCACAWIAIGVSRMVESIERGKTVSTVSAVVASLAFLGICLVLYAFVRHAGYSWDLTREGRTPLSEQTVQLLRGLDKEVAVFGVFLKAGDRDVQIRSEKARRFLERCQQHTANLTVEFFDPERNVLKAESLELGNLSPQGAVVLKCGTRRKVINFSDVNDRLEEGAFTQALIYVARDSVPKLYVLTGHDEPPLPAMSELTARLGEEAYVLEEFAINVLDPQIPSDCNVLVINGPKGDLQLPEVKAIQEYLQRGGRMLVLLEPWRVISTGVEHFLPMLRQNYGIDVGTDIILSRAKSTQEMVLVVFTPNLGLIGVDAPDIPRRGSYNEEHLITRGFDQNMVFSLSRSVSLAPEKPEGVAGDILLYSLPGTWAETDLNRLFDERKANPDEDDPKGPVGVAVAVTASTGVQVADSDRTRDARIVVVGDQDFVSNDKIRVVGHWNFLLNILAWLTETEELVGVRPARQDDPPLQLTANQDRAIAWVTILGAFQAIVVIGIVIFALRRKYQ